MQYKPLGSTGIQISSLAFGAGPIPAVMTSDGSARQRAVIERALEAGINWFDTAASYGAGQSERSLGAALNELDAASQVYVATKVRLVGEDLEDIPRSVRASLAGSLERLGLSRVTLLQLHNAITALRGDEPTSLAPHDVLGPGGVLETFQRLQAEGLAGHLGITAIGQAEALHEVIRSGQFDTIQVPYNLMNPSAGQGVPDDFQEANYGNIIAECARQRMGVLAIRVFAGGALAGQPPTAHTYKTKFFPLDLYQRDQQRAARMEKLLGCQLGVKEAAVRFVHSHTDVSAAIIGFSEPAHVDEALAAMQAGPLPADTLKILRRLEYHSVRSHSVSNG